MAPRNLSIENQEGNGNGISTVRRLATSMGGVFFMEITDSGTTAGVSLKQVLAKREL